MFPFVSVPHQNHCLLYSQLLCFYIFIYIVRPFLRLSSWFLFPSMQLQCNAFAGSRSLPILDTCPNQFSLRSAILSTSVVSLHRISHTVSFLILSRLVTLNNLLNHVISAVRIRLSSSLLKHQHSEPYSSTGTTKVSYSFTSVSLLTHLLTDDLGSIYSCISRTQHNLFLDNKKPQKSGYTAKHFPNSRSSQHGRVYKNETLKTTYETNHFIANCPESVPVKEV